MNTELKTGLLQSFLLAFYISIIGSVMSNADTFFGKQDTFMTPILVLTMFSVSVLICALIVFKKPYELFFDGKKKEAINVVVYTAVSLFIILILLFGVMIVLK